MEPTQRDDLIQKVLEGELTAVQAEAEAARLNLPPLRGKPDASKFDPASQTWWTLPMVVSWIAFRSIDVVREQWDAYRKECRVWHDCRWTRGTDGRVYEGFDLVPWPHANWTLLYLSASDTEEKAVLEKARRSLWGALES